MSTKYQGIERRKYERYEFPYPVKFALKGTNKFETSLCGNISSGGLLLVSSTHFAERDALDIVISYSIENQVFVMTLEAQIAWIKKDGLQGQENRRSVLGIEFTNLTEEQNRQLQKFIEGYCKAQKSSNETGPRDAREFFIRGVKRFHDNMEGALQDFNRVIELDPSHSAAYYYRAFVRDRSGDLKGAEEDFKKAKELGQGQ